MCGKRAGRVYACACARAHVYVVWVHVCVCADVREGRAHSRKRCRAAVSAAPSGLDLDHRTIRCCWAESSRRTASAHATRRVAQRRTVGATSAFALRLPLLEGRCDALSTISWVAIPVTIGAWGQWYLKASPSSSTIVPLPLGGAAYELAVCRRGSNPSQHTEATSLTAHGGVGQ